MRKMDFGAFPAALAGLPGCLLVQSEWPLRWATGEADKRRRAAVVEIVADKKRRRRRRWEAPRRPAVAD